MVLQEEYSMVYLAFAFEMGARTLKIWGEIFQSVTHLHPCHPQKQRAVNSFNAAV